MYPDISRTPSDGVTSKSLGDQVTQLTKRRSDFGVTW